MCASLSGPEVPGLLTKLFYVEKLTFSTESECHSHGNYVFCPKLVSMTAETDPFGVFEPNWSKKKKKKKLC